MEDKIGRAIKRMIAFLRIFRVSRLISRRRGVQLPSRWWVDWWTESHARKNMAPLVGLDGLQAAVACCIRNSGKAQDGNHHRKPP